jgi:hypothetical protein
MSAYQFNPSVEQWKEINGFPGYEVSDHGQVRSYWKYQARPSRMISKPYIMKQFSRCKKHKRLAVNLHKNREMTLVYVYHLVLEAFNGPCPNGMECCHRDGDKFNNKLNNIRWDTTANNYLDNLHNGKGRFTYLDIITIIALHKCGMAKNEIGNIFDTDKSYIGSIVRRKTWKHVDFIPV